jgi:5-methylcytosine-specific restriction endonuclease McrA
MSLKECTNCHQLKPANADFFHLDSTKNDGLYPRCRACRIKHDPRIPKTPDQIEAKKKAELERKKRERDLRNQRNPEKYKAQLERKRAAQRQRRKNNPRRYIQYQDEYRKRFPERARFNGRIQRSHRRAKEFNLPNTFTSDDWNRCLDYFNNTCAYCGSQQDFWHTLEADHYIPITNPNCPGHVSTNIVPACKSCNASKGNKHPDLWLTDKFSGRLVDQIKRHIQGYFQWLV